jgi:hypothetical protein
VVEGALTAAGSGEQAVPASDYRALQSQVRELQRLLGKKTLETEIRPQRYDPVLAVIAISFCPNLPRLRASRPVHPTT